MTQASMNSRSCCPASTRWKHTAKVLRRSKTSTIRAGEILVENISLEVADVTATVTVSSDAGACRRPKQRLPLLSNRHLQTLPLPNEQLLDALPLVPGVVRGPTGRST